MNLVAISPGPIDPDMRPGYYLRHVGYGIEVIVVGPMPNTPADFEIELARRFGTRYEITHAAGVGAPDGIDESQFYRRGFWRMSFYPSNRIRHGDVPETRTEARPPRRRPRDRTPEAVAAALDAEPNPDVRVQHVPDTAAAPRPRTTMQRVVAETMARAEAVRLREARRMADAILEAPAPRTRIDWSTEPDPHGGTPRPRTTGQIDTLARRFLIAEAQVGTGAAMPEPLRGLMTPHDQSLFDARVRVLRQEMAEPSHTAQVISRGDVADAVDRAFQRLDRVRGGDTGVEVVGAPEDVRRFRSPTGD